MGPGFKNHKTMLKLIKLLIPLKCPVVLDAEALNALASRKAIRLPQNWIMTPHEAELARLMGVTSQDIQKRRQYFVKLAQKKWGCVILLKGHQTLIASADKIFQIQSGNAALAKAGTGDVLTGMILAFLSQKLEPLQAASLAAFIHGRIADQWLKNKKDVLSLTASDLIDQLPEELYKIRPKSQLKDF